MPVEIFMGAISTELAVPSDDRDYLPTKINKFLEEKKAYTATAVPLMCDNHFCTILIVYEYKKS